ncbi:PepSY-associated TM helix domain-containing protein [Mangrovibacter yixingensis]|uniref:PepSY-associated TM helix domain-containing protein n=1 Tax=Mangrovibacter yixingensis TaxID=1529639 RepID=UPI001CFB07B6|nr:PepSY-associated TM helix domain-containing protein [Mangrovibacter yixingensis]
MISEHSSPGGRGAFVHLLRRLHFYIGLFVGPFIFLAAFTGTVYVLTPQLENAWYASTLFVTPQGEAQPLSRQVEAARRYVGPDEPFYAVRPAPGPQDTTRVQFADSTLGASRSRAVFINPYTLAVTGDMPVYGTSGVLPLRTWIDEFHRSLQLGVVGRNYSELAASWMWVAALGGMVLWWQTRVKKRRNGPVRGAKARTRHWHIVLGLSLLVGMVFFSATGLTWSRWAGGNIDTLRSNLGWMTPQVRTSLTVDGTPTQTDPHAMHHMQGGMVMAGPVQDWDKVLAAARQAGISANKIEIRPPKKMGTAWTVTEINRAWPTQVDAVAVNPTNFHIVDAVHFANFPLVAKLTRWGIDAHMGILFGLANQILLVVFGFGVCVLIALGYRQWWLRRPARTELPLSAAWFALPARIRVVVAVLAAALGYCLPVMGVSLVAFLSVDVLRGYFGRSRLVLNE